MEPWGFEMAAQETCPSVRNAFRLLESLAGSPDGMRLTHLADATGLPKSSTHRILGTLEELEIVCREEGAGAYHLAARWRRVVTPGRVAEFSAPVVTDGVAVAGLTLRLRGQVSSGSRDRLSRLVADLAYAVSRRFRV